MLDQGLSFCNQGLDLVLLLKTRVKGICLRWLRNEYLLKFKVLKVQLLYKLLGPNTNQLEELYQELKIMMQKKFTVNLMSNYKPYKILNYYLSLCKICIKTKHFLYARFFLTFMLNIAKLNENEDYFSKFGYFQELDSSLCGSIKDSISIKSGVKNQVNLKKNQIQKYGTIQLKCGDSQQKQQEGRGPLSHLGESRTSSKTHKSDLDVKGSKNVNYNLNIFEVECNTLLAQLYCESCDLETAKIYALKALNQYQAIVEDEELSYMYTKQVALLRLIEQKIDTVNT